MFKARKRHLCLFCIPVVLFAADQSWRQKPTAEWNDQDVQQILTDSPWAKQLKPKLSNFVSGPAGASVGAGGIGMEFPRRRRMSRPPSSTASSKPPTLTVRWESALPEQVAELKARNTSAPAVDGDHYVIAVYGIPSQMINSDNAGLENALKERAVIKRKGKKDIKPSGVEVIPRDDSTVVVYSFSRSKEITQEDKEVEFDAQIGRLQIAQPFALDDMMYQGKLSL